MQRELSTKLTEGLYSKSADLQIMQNDSRTNSSVTPNGVPPPFTQRRLLRFGSLVQRELSTKLTEGLYSKSADLQIMQNDSRTNSSVTPNGVPPPFTQRRLLRFGSLVQRELSTKLTEGLYSKSADLQIMQNDSRNNPSVTAYAVPPPFTQGRLRSSGDDPSAFCCAKPTSLCWGEALWWWRRLEPHSGSSHGRLRFWKIFSRIKLGLHLALHQLVHSFVRVLTVLYYIIYS